LRTFSTRVSTNSRFSPPSRTPTGDGWSRYRDAYQRNKYICSDITRIPDPIKTLIDELQSPRFLHFLEELTGIKSLIPDPYLEGGGLHLSGAGGVLRPHTDFHTYDRLKLFRQINALVYLNPGWTEEQGGNLCLYADEHARVVSKRVVPKYGTCVIFRTDDRSIHGFPEPIAEQSWRRSIALYYYTSYENSSYSGDWITYWRTFGDHRGANKARLIAFRGLRALGRGFAAVAFRIDPNRRAKP